MFVNYMLFVDAMSIQPPSCSGVFLLPGQVEIAAFFRWGNHSSVGAKMDTQTHDRQAWSLYDWLTPSGGISLLKKATAVWRVRRISALRTGFRLTPYQTKNRRRWLV